MTATAAKLAPAIVTKDELAEIAKAEKTYADAKKKQAAAELEVKLLRFQLAEKVLGITSEDELKKLGPDQVLKRMAKRFEAGAWSAQKGSPEFEFVKTSQGRYPGWKEIYSTEHGIAAALKITDDTPVSFSYAVAVSAQ